MIYDNKDRPFSPMNFISDQIIFIFYYTGRRLIFLTQTNVDVPADVIDVLFTYNGRGQNARQDDDAPVTINFEYENCNGNISNAKTGSSQSNRSSVASTTNRHVKLILIRGSAKSMIERNFSAQTKQADLLDQPVSLFQIMIYLLHIIILLQPIHEF
jgi:hypothetical protein